MASDATLCDAWFGVEMDMVQREMVNALARELALQSELVGREEGVWHLRVESGSLNQPTTRDRLQTALAAVGHPVRLEISTGPVADSASRRLAAAAQARQREAEALIAEDPFVQDMLARYGGKIVPGTLKPA